MTEPRIGFGMTRPGFLTDNRIYCGECGAECDPLGRVRLRSKSKKAWRCDVCASRITQLRRSFGHWPTPSFTRMPAEEQLDFMQALRDKPRKGQIEIVANDRLSKYESHEEYYDMGGSYLPASAWGVKGYDPQRIEENSKPEDTWECPVVGMTFRVPIRSGGKRGVRGDEQTEALEGGGKRRKLKAKGSDDEEEPPAEPEDLFSSNSEAESSSSSSRRRHKHKKHKHKKRKSSKHSKQQKSKDKDRAARETERQAEKKLKAQNSQNVAEKKLEDRRAAANYKLTENIAPKILGVLTKLEGAMRCEGFLECSHAIQRNSQDLLATLKEMMKDVKIIMEEDKGHPIYGGIDSSGAAKIFLSDAQRRTDTVIGILSLSGRLLS